MRHFIHRFGIYLILIALALLFILPFCVVLMTSLKGMDQIHTGSIFSLPTAPSFQAWHTAWTSVCTGLDCGGMQRGFWNSISITVPGALGCVIVGALNGYALAFGRIRGANGILLVLMLGVFIPYQVILYPLVKIFSYVGLFERLPGIVAIHILFGIPICTLIFRNFYVTLPGEIYRAAQVDGAGFFRIFFQIMLPMSINIAIVALILQVTGIWNDYLLGLIFAGHDNLPMTAQLNSVINTGTGVTEYNVSMAATVITALPPLFLYFISGRFFVRGITAGAVKG